GRGECFASTDLEREKGIEPSPPAWKAGALPLSYSRPLFARPFLAAPVRVDRPDILASVRTYGRQHRRDHRGGPFCNHKSRGVNPSLLCEVEPVEVHHLVPGGDEVLHKLLLPIGRRVD